jgi:hypothetical protein
MGKDINLSLVPIFLLTSELIKRWHEAKENLTE